MKISSVTLHQHIRSDLGILLDQGPERTPKGFAASALNESLLKKEVSQKSLDADQKALDLFLKVNSELISAPRCETLMDEGLLGELKRELYQFYYPSGSEQLVSHHAEVAFLGRTGPGTSLGSKHDDFYSKLFNSKLTVTNRGLYETYRELYSKVPLWGDAEVERRTHFGDCDITDCSKLLFVPKRNDISRTICVEPSLNMFFQLGLGKIIERRLFTRYGCNLATQPDFNRRMARIGSITGQFATIDLSSASDSLSLGVLKEILPASFYRWLTLYRTPKVKLPDGSTVGLNMVSTMGNGFTFPLETMLFQAVVRSAYWLVGIPYVKNQTKCGSLPGNFGVFGDDIIVEKKAFHVVCRLLWLLGFQVNADKTFFEGPFRESCGADFFKGEPVRGVYIKSLRTPQDRYVAINLLNDWSATNGIKLPSAIQYLLTSVRWTPVPPESNYDEGIHVPLRISGLKRLDVNGAVCYHSYKAVPRYHRIGECGTIAGRALVNLPGLLLSYIGGYIRSGKIGYRQFTPFYRVEKGRTPRWDFLPLTRSCRRFDFAQWSSTVHANFYM